MGSIVFATIVENIKSFFGKEDELLAEAKSVPEAASEVFEKPAKIVEKPLPKEQPKLPFSPDELRHALVKKEDPKDDKPFAEERDISHEITAFESALFDVPETKENLPATKEAVPVTPKQGGFFGEFEQFLMHEDLETEGLLDTDILHRMKEFHKSRREGKEYYVYSKDVKTAIGRKLHELKTLEQEWFHSREQMDELERGITQIEHEIEARSRDVKGLLMQAKSKSRLEKTVPSGKEFVLPDGRKLTSLLDLKIALRTMPPEIFQHHVSAGRNDFADWVRGTGEPEVADEMGKIRDRHQMDVFLSRLAG